MIARQALPALVALFLGSFVMYLHMIASSEQGRESAAASQTLTQFGVATMVDQVLEEQGLRPKQRTDHDGKPVTDEKYRGGGTDRGMHLVLTTDCTPYQQWQSQALIHSARQVGQRAPITMIVSGCENNHTLMRAFHPEIHENFHIHFAPTFSPLPQDCRQPCKPGDDYPPYNRPMGIRDWLESSARPIEESIIAILDPDELFLRPLALGQDHVLFTRPDGRSSSAWTDRPRDIVTEGHPIGQTYLIGGQWIGWNTTMICGAGSPCTRVNDSEAWDYYSLGPPWIIHINDLRKIVQFWAEITPRVRVVFPDLLAEQYAYAIASAHYGLRHLRLDHYMISNPHCWGEGWEWIDLVDKAASCDTPDMHLSRYAAKTPTLIHFCQNWHVRGWNFFKRHAPDMLSCDTPLFKIPPADLRKAVWDMYRDRAAWAICNVVSRVNAALLHYKKHVCNARTMNLNRTLRLESHQLFGDRHRGNFSEFSSEQAEATEPIFGKGHVGSSQDDLKQWVLCAEEGGRCECNGTQVRYGAVWCNETDRCDQLGAAGTWRLCDRCAGLVETLGVLCTNPTFGSDPLPGHHKSCYCRVASESAADVGDTPFQVRFEVQLTSGQQGSFVVEVRPDWQPVGAKHFRDLVLDGLYSAGGGMRFFRVLKDFVAQFGISGDPAMSKKWRGKTVADDVKRPDLKESWSHAARTVSFATGGPNTRETQMFINLVDNRQLDDSGVCCVGKVVEGWDAVLALHLSPNDGVIDQGRIHSEGNLYLTSDPEGKLLSYIRSATVL